MIENEPIVHGREISPRRVEGKANDHESLSKRNQNKIALRSSHSVLSTKT
jgi:hypothetical protein